MDDTQHAGQRDGTRSARPAGMQGGLQRCRERTGIYMRLFSLLNPARKHNPAGKKQNTAVPGPCSTAATGLRLHRPRRVPGAEEMSLPRRGTESVIARDGVRQGSHASHALNRGNLTALQKHLRFSIALQSYYMYINIDGCISVCFKNI